MRKDTTTFRYHQDTEHTTDKCMDLAKVLGKMKPTVEAPPPPPVRKVAVIPTGHRAPK